MTISRVNITSGSSFEESIGYSRAVAIGDTVLVSGTTGYNYDTGEISDDVVAQTEQTLVNISRALATAGADIKDVVQVRYILPDRKDFPLIWPVLRKWFGQVRPVATMFQAELADEKMRVEIEVTAMKGVEKVTQHDISGPGRS